MKIQLSTFEDIPGILKIIEDAKNYLASLNIDQWQNGYPNSAQIENDIKNGESYVVVDSENRIIATSMFTIRKEPTYNTIEGKWQVDENKIYGVVHRMAIKKEYRKEGIATLLFEGFHQQLKDKKIESLKIDTHEDNLGMQKLIKKIGYKYCGIIHTNYNAKRMAFEKIIQ